VIFAAVANIRNQGAFVGKFRKISDIKGCGEQKSRRRKCPDIFGVSLHAPAYTVTTVISILERRDRK
jgi:hypothetical protein